ncbi:partner of Y14 and mago [Coccinella septempunctata]|uniref:partner of Y14 and mago n=1 Tax=Coccinella septempunctata TaxID=41139 RepID=UPI001D078578|nr:partner of Y14 and mago [Coccinella septempunctata]
MSTISANVVTSDGTFIPASQRPDGTWRKARRVKDGYVPQEEVPLYESKGKQFMNKSGKPQPLVLPTGHIAHQTIPGLFILEDKTKEQKTSKKKSKKNTEIETLSSKVDNMNLNTQKNVPSKPANGNKGEDKGDTELSPEKKIKNLKKKVREIEALEEKLKNGTITKPEPEQLQKIKRKNDLLLQIHELEKSL